MVANTSMKYASICPHATASIKRWTLSNGCNQGNLIAHCSSPTKLAELHKFSNNQLTW